MKLSNRDENRTNTVLNVCVKNITIQMINVFFLAETPEANSQINFL